MTARSVGWEVLGKRVGEVGDAKTLINTGVQDVHRVIETERNMPNGQYGGDLRPKTRWNLQKVLRYRTPAAVVELEKKAEDHIVRPVHLYICPCSHRSIKETILAKPVAHKEIQNNKQVKTEKPDDDKVVGLTLKNLKRKAGETMPGGRRSPLHLAQGVLGKELSKTSSWFDRRKLGIDRSEFWSRV
jgi:large subunit ribosomal protein L17